MVDLGRPPNFGTAEAVVELIRVQPAVSPGPQFSQQFELFTTDESPSLYRLRFANFIGEVTGSVGGVTFTLQGLTSGLLGDPWPAGGPLVVASPVDVLFGEQFSVTWNTEIADNYSGVERDFGRTIVLGLPLLYLPRETTFSLHATSQGGFDGDYVIFDGMIQMERFAPDTVTAVIAGTADLYLLPALG